MKEISYWYTIFDWIKNNKKAVLIAVILFGIWIGIARYMPEPKVPKKKLTPFNTKRRS